MHFSTCREIRPATVPVLEETGPNHHCLLITIDSPSESRSSMSIKPDFSLLELASVREGDSVSTTLANSVAYAQHAEKLGFKRFWLAEHHNMEGITSSATSVLVGHIAGKTDRKSTRLNSSH